MIKINWQNDLKVWVFRISFKHISMNEFMKKGNMYIENWQSENHNMSYLMYQGLVFMLYKDLPH